MDSQSPLHNLAYSIFAYTLVLTLVAVIIIFFWWLIRLYRKTRRVYQLHALPSKIWVCKRCWYCEYAEKSRPCPHCEERRNQGETWLPKDDLSRGQPAQERVYRARQGIMDTNS